jgi:hypothetical protein
MIKIELTGNFMFPVMYLIQPKLILPFNRCSNAVIQYHFFKCNIHGVCIIIL